MPLAQGIRARQGEMAEIKSIRSGLVVKDIEAVKVIHIQYSTPEGMLRSRSDARLEKDTFCRMILWSVGSAQTLVFQVISLYIL